MVKIGKREIRLTTPMTRMLLMNLAVLILIIVSVAFGGWLMFLGILFGMTVGGFITTYMIFRSKMFYGVRLMIVSEFNKQEEAKVEEDDDP